MGPPLAGPRYIILLPTVSVGRSIYASQHKEHLHWRQQKKTILYMYARNQLLSQLRWA